MGHAKYVGRVGALAVALGVGSAIAAAPAWAEPDSAPSGSESSSSTPAGTAGTTATTPSAESLTTGSGSDESSSPNSSPTSPVTSVNGEVVSPTQPKATKPAKPKKKSSKSADKTIDKTEPTTPKPSSAQQDSTTPAATSSKPSSTTAPQSTPAAATSTPAQTVNTVVTPAVTAPVVTSTPAATVKATALSGVSSPFDAFGGTGAPVESPVSWVVLAASRKELDSLLTGSAPVNTGSQAVVNAAAAPVVNQPPVVNPTSTSVDPTTGTITGTMGASDPENKKLTYALKAGPTTGKLAFDAKTGAFTYTPTTAQRILSAVGSPQTAKFTATVSDGVAANVKTVEVTLTVSPAPITDKGVIATGSTTIDSSIAITNTRAYVTNSTTNTIAVIDTINGTIVGSIELDNAPASLAVTPNGKKLYVTDQDTNLVYVYDTATDTPKPLRVIDFGADREPYGVSASPDGKTLYVTGTRYDPKAKVWNTVVTKVSTTTDKVTGTVKLPGAVDTFYALTVTPDSSRVYVVADLPEDADGFIAGALFTFTSSSTTATRVVTGDYLVDLVVSRDGKRAYLNDVNTGVVSVIDTKTNKVVDSFDTAVQAVSGFTISADGTVLYAVDTSTNSMVAFETTSGDFAQIASTAVAASTEGYFPFVWTSPDGQQLYYASHDGLQVTSLVPANAFPTVTPNVNTPGTTGVVTGAVGGNDTNGDPLKYTNTGAPTKGTLVLNTATGAFTYTPTAAARHAASALTATTADRTDTFTVTVDDGRSGIVTKTITVNILPANVTPTVKSTVGKPNSTTGVATGSVVGTDKDKDVLIYTTSTPAKGTVTVDAKGKFVYTPTAQVRHDAATGDTDSFTVTIDDRHGGVINQLVTVKIIPKNSVPTVKVVVYNPDTTTGTVFGKITATDADQDPITFTVRSTALKGTVIFNDDHTFIYTPTIAARRAAAASGAPSSARSDKFTMEIADGHGAVQTVTVTLRVTPFVNQAPEAGGPPDYNYFHILDVNNLTGVVRGDLNVTDPDGDTVTYRLKPHTSDDNWDALTPEIGSVSVDANTGSWTFTPTAFARGENWLTHGIDETSFAIIASDGKASTTVYMYTPIVPAANPAVIDLVPYRSEGNYGSGSVAASSDGKFVYSIGDAFDPVTHNSAPVVSVIDTSSGTVVKEIPLANPFTATSTMRGNGIVFDGTAGRVYVSSYVYDRSISQYRSSVSVIDTSTNTVIATMVPFDNSTIPHFDGASAEDGVAIVAGNMALSPDAKTLYVTGHYYRNDINCDWGVVSVIDVRTSTVLTEITYDNRGGGGTIVATQDGSRVYVDGGDFITRKYLVTVIDTSTNKVVSEINTGNVDYITGHGGVAISADGTRLYASGGKYDDSGNYKSVVWVFNTTTNALIAEIPSAPVRLGSDSTLRLSPDGSKLYVVANNKIDQKYGTSGANQWYVSVIDTRTNSLATSSQGSFPSDFYAAELSPDGTRLYISGHQNVTPRGGADQYPVVITVVDTAKLKSWDYGTSL